MDDFRSGLGNALDKTETLSCNLSKKVPYITEAISKRLKRPPGRDFCWPKVEQSEHQHK